MTYTDRRPGEGNRGDDDQLAGEVNKDRIPPSPRRRGYGRWGDRHRRRLDRIFAGRDPWTGDDDGEWSAAELLAFQLAAAHLRSLGLCGSWQTPPTVAQTWRHRHHCCTCGRDAA